MAKHGRRVEGCLAGLVRRSHVCAGRQQLLNITGVPHLGCRTESMALPLHTSIHRGAGSQQPGHHTGAPPHRSQIERDAHVGGRGVAGEEAVHCRRIPCLRSALQRAGAGDHDAPAGSQAAER